MDHSRPDDVVAPLPADLFLAAVWRAIATARNTTPPMPLDDLIDLLHTVADVLEEVKEIHP